MLKLIPSLVSVSIASFSSFDKPFWQLYSVSPAMVWTCLLFPPLLPGWSAVRREPWWKKGVIEFPVIKMRSGQQRQQRIMVACPRACCARDEWSLCIVYLWMLMFSVGGIAIVLRLSSQRLCEIMGSFYVMMCTSLKGLLKQCCSYAHETGLIEQILLHETTL